MHLDNNIAFLYSLEKFGMKLGLQNTYALLEQLGNPQNEFNSIHIAGTNGKGSVSSFISSILIEHGINTGHYTSPHLEKFNERIKVNNITISDDELGVYTNQIKDFIIDKKATFFEATTAIAFKYFADKKIEFGVIETGLGGRFDSTNVINPFLSIITNISIDHVQQLGNTIESIAYEKAGIIKNNIPCITGSDNKSALEIFGRVCLEKSTCLKNVNEIFKINTSVIKPDGIQINISDDVNNYEIFSPLNGCHQIKNIMCAVEAIKYLNESKLTSIPRKTIENGIANVIINTGLHCRFDTFSKKPYIILDVAHNVDSVLTLTETIKLMKKNKLHIIFGIMKDKDYEKVINLLSAIGDQMYCVKPSTERALEPEMIAEHIDEKGKATVYGSIHKAIDAALLNYAENDLILITGSHYVCGEALPHLREKCLDKI